MPKLTEIEDSPRAIPPLQPGDRLHRSEFERRYRAMPDCKKAELIEGVVYVPAATRLSHGQNHGLLMGWMINYSNGTFCERMGSNCSRFRRMESIAAKHFPSCG